MPYLPVVFVELSPPIHVHCPEAGLYFQRSFSKPDEDSEKPFPPNNQKFPCLSFHVHAPIRLPGEFVAAATPIIPQLPLVSAFFSPSIQVHCRCAADHWEIKNKNSRVQYLFFIKQCIVDYVSHIEYDQIKADLDRGEFVRGAGFELVLI